jgi:hypothetical protein
MNVTRQVVTDLLPVYLSGEASADTRVLVEDYFRQDPEFERIARSAATPLETLRAAAPIAGSPERKKRDLESVFLGLRRRKWLFGVALFLTLSPLSFEFNSGNIVSVMLPQALWHAAFDWSLAAVLWFLYFTRLPLRTASLVCATFFTLIPIPFVAHSVSVGGPVAEYTIFWIVAAWLWFGYFRPRPC